MHALLWLYLGIYRFEYTARSTIRTGDGIFVVHLHLMLMHFDPKCRGAVGVCACKNSITTAVDFVAHALIHIDTSISSGKENFFSFSYKHTQNIHSKTHSQKWKKERKLWPILFRLAINISFVSLLIKKNFFWSFSLRKHTHNYNKT